MQTINKILVIEDNPADLLLLKETLGSISYSQLLTATRLSELESMSHLVPDLIFLDLNLPDGRGMETFVTVNRLFPASAIIVLSGLEDEKMAMQTLQAGAQDYITDAMKTPGRPFSSYGMPSSHEAEVERLLGPPGISPGTDARS